MQKSIAKGYRHIRVQFGNYGGGGFIPAGQGVRPEGGYGGAAFDEEMYVDRVPRMFEQVRAKVGFAPKLCHDVHSHLTAMNAAEFCRRMQSMQMFFVEDVLAPEQIAARLDDRFRLLSGGRRALPRHQTLQAAIDWSHELLGEPERLLLRRCAVFSGGWSLEATEAVCADPAGDVPAEHALDPVEVLDLLTRLVEKSLVVADRLAARADSTGRGS